MNFKDGPTSYMLDMTNEELMTLINSLHDAIQGTEPLSDVQIFTYNCELKDALNIIADRKEIIGIK